MATIEGEVLHGLISFKGWQGVINQGLCASICLTPRSRPAKGSECLMLELRFSKVLANLHIVGDGAHFAVADRLKLLVCYDEKLGQLICETYSKITL